MLNYWWKKFYLAGYDDPAGDPPAGDPPPPPPAPEGKNAKPGGTFTQADVDRLMANQRKELTRRNEKLVADLERIKGLASTTEKDRDELQTQIDELKNQFVSKEELLKRESEKYKTEAEKEKKKLLQDRDQWQTKYTRTRITNEIVAKSAADAYNVDQIIELLAPKSRVVDALGEDGKPTGEDQVRVKLPTVKDGKPTTLDITVEEAITLMKQEVSRYGNLFKSNLVGGVGGSNAPGGGGNSKNPPRDPGAYRTWRKTQGLT